MDKTKRNWRSQPQEVILERGFLAREEADWQGKLEAVNSPKLIIEVLSPSTEAYDRGRKFLHYQELVSILEYVLINWQRQLVEIYQRQDGKWTISVTSQMKM